MNNEPNVKEINGANENTYAETKLFMDSKSTLTKYYDSLRNSCAVRIIGFTAGLFTLIQTFQTSKDYPLSNLFHYLPTVKIDFLSIEAIELLKLAFFFTGASLLLLLIIRSIFKFALYSCYANQLLWIDQNEMKYLPEFLQEKTVDIKLHETAGRKIAGNLKDSEGNVIQKRMKLYWLFPYDWFITGATWSKKSRRGFLLCIGFSIIFTLIFFFLLW